MAAAALDAFATGPWGTRFPTVAAPLAAGDSFKIVKNRGHFPSDDAATRLLYLALRNIEKDWKMPQHIWKQANAMRFGMD
jgi:hypothetical protein